MGSIRKMMSVSTLGLVKYRSNGEQLARAATIKAKADAKVSRERAKLARAARRQLENDET